MPGDADRTTNGRTHRLVYEELFFAEPAEQNRASGALRSFFGIDTVTSDRTDSFVRPERSKLNSPATYRLLPNADEIEHVYRSDLTDISVHQVFLSLPRPAPTD